MFVPNTDVGCGKYQLPQRVATLNASEEISLPKAGGLKSSFKPSPFGLNRVGTSQIPVLKSLHWWYLPKHQLSLVAVTTYWILSSGKATGLLTIWVIEPCARRPEVINYFLWHFGCRGWSTTMEVSLGPASAVILATFAITVSPNGLEPLIHPLRFNNINSGADRRLRYRVWSYFVAVKAAGVGVNTPSLASNGAGYPAYKVSVPTAPGSGYGTVYRSTVCARAFYRCWRCRINC